MAGNSILITGEHGTIWDAHPPMMWLDYWAHQRSKLVICNSHASAKMLTSKYNISPKKIKVVYNAIAKIPKVHSKKIRIQLGVSDDVFIIGSIGRLDTSKDYATYVDAAKIILKKRHDAVFVLIGGGPLEGELKDYISASGLNERFLMMGWREDARALLQGFDIFVSTSIRESFGNVLIEAALCQIPVIAPAVDGIPEAVLHEKTGILLPPTRTVRKNLSPNAGGLPKYVVMDGQLQPPRSLNPELLANSILALLNNPDLRFQYGTQASERAKKLFSLNRYVSELESIYLEL
jgi:glycosyltransferase involved in cell wall biosynthesis